MDISMDGINMLHFERSFFGCLSSATENGDDRPYDDRHLSFLFRSGLILVFSVYPDLLGQKVLFFFPASFYSRKQHFFHTSPGAFEITDDTAMIDTLYYRYTFELGAHGLSRKEKGELITLSHLILDRKAVFPSHLNKRRGLNK